MPKSAEITRLDTAPRPDWVIVSAGNANWKLEVSEIVAIQTWFSVCATTEEPSKKRKQYTLPKDSQIRTYNAKFMQIHSIKRCQVGESGIQTDVVKRTASETKQSELVHLFLYLVFCSINIHAY